MRRENKRKGENHKMFEIIVKSLKRKKWNILIDTVFLILNIYLLTIPPKIIGNIIDIMSRDTVDTNVIVQYIFFLLGVSLANIVCRVIWKYAGTCVQRGFERDVKDKLFEHVMKLKLTEMQKKKNGELMTYFVKDITDIRAFAWRVLAFVPRILATCIFAIGAMMINVDIKLTIFCMLPLLLSTFVIVKIRKYIDMNFRKAQKQFTNLSEYVQESTDSIRTTKAYSQEEHQIEVFKNKNRKLRSSNISVDVHQNLLNITIQIAFGISYGIAILYGGNLVLTDAISVGDFVAFNSYIALFVGPVSWIPGLLSKWKTAQVAYHRLDDIMQLEKEREGIVTKQGLEDGIQGNIRISNLNYHYPEYMDCVLKNINLDIKQGQTLGIIGTIGSGKTTLMNLLLRLYPAPRGKITIDGRDINDIPIPILRDNICYITQDNFLFSDTIKENIKLFKEGYKDEEIKESTKKAMIYDEIKQMPDSIHTVLAERGGDLSGGQKQRVVISRAFLNKSNVIIFDDTFSALDNKTEELLMQNIKELTKGKTCIIISNRISDIKQSDHILVLEEGEIIEEGTHDTLLEERGKYYQFYQEQSVRKEGSILN